MPWLSSSRLSKYAAAILPAARCFTQRALVARNKSLHLLDSPSKMSSSSIDRASHLSRVDRVLTDGDVEVLSRKARIINARYAQGHGRVFGSLSALHGKQEVRVLLPCPPSPTSRALPRTASLTNISLHPGADTFISCGWDDTVHLWAGGLFGGSKE